MLQTPCRSYAMRPVSSMLFDLEDAQDDCAQCPAMAQAVKKTQELVNDASESVSEVSCVLAQLTQQDDLVAAAEAMGYSVRLRDCVGGGPGATCLQNLRHSYLILAPTAQCSGVGEAIVIDPTFRDQFLIAHPSPRYSAVLETLPPVFIGAPSKVQPLVEHLCSEMAQAFRAAGIVMPPWRNVRSMMTKWLPRKSLDIALSGCAATSCTVADASPPTAVTRTPSSSLAAASRKKSYAGNRLLRQAFGTTESGSSSNHSSAASPVQSNGSSTSTSSSSSAGGAQTVLLRSSTVSVGHSQLTITAAGRLAHGSADTGSHNTPPAGALHTGHTLLYDTDTATRTQPPIGHQGGARCARFGRPTANKCFEPMHRVVGGFAPL